MFTYIVTGDPTLLYIGLIVVSLFGSTLNNMVG